MSTDEEKQAIGQIVVDYQDAKRRLAALHSQAEAIGKKITHIGQTLQHADPGRGSLSPDYLSALNAEKILPLVDEIHSTFERVNDLQQKLQSLGLVPLPPSA